MIQYSRSHFNQVSVAFFSMHFIRLDSLQQLYRAKETNSNYDLSMKAYKIHAHLPLMLAEDGFLLFPQRAIMFLVGHLPTCLALIVGPLSRK